MKERCRDGCRTSLLIAGVVLVPAIFHTSLPPCHPYITIHFMEMIFSTCNNNICMHRLDNKGCVRVGDFGLAEDMYSRGYVREDSRTVKIPYKWMPPESLEDALFSELSDVVTTHTPIISTLAL